MQKIIPHAVGVREKSTLRAASLLIVAVDHSLTDHSDFTADYQIRKPLVCDLSTFGRRQKFTARHQEILIVG